MTGWEPATEAEVAMRDALRAQDQQRYFRVLTRVDLLLPVPGAAPAGQSPVGWGTWTTGGRTHVLAFTSAAALRACLGENAGATRRVPYAELAAGWPNHEWWLAVNPGLPIEGYLPAWYVAQLARGDVRLPGRTMGARARLERVETAARARAAATTSGRGAPASPVPAPPAGRAAPAPPGPGGPVPPAPSASAHPAVPAPRTTGGAEPSGGAAARPVPANGHRMPARPAPLGPRAEDGATRGDGWPERPSGSTGAGAPAARSAPEPSPADRAGWLADLRRRADEPEPSARAGRSGEPAPPPARSFFEPTSRRASGQPAAPDPAGRAGERAVPPSRFARGTQPFPRRRPLNEPVPADPTQAFRLDAAAEATQAIRPAEPPRLFRPATPAAEEATQALPRRRPGGAAPGGEEPTRPITADQPAGTADRAGAEPAAAEEVPASLAEPVSGPPVARRGFSPIVIEGTVIESRDLTAPEEPSPPRPAAGPEPVVPEPYAVPTVPDATSAMAAATVPAAFRSDADGEPAPWAGPADPTVPLALHPPSAPAEGAGSAASPPGPAAPVTGRTEQTGERTDLFGERTASAAAGPVAPTVVDPAAATPTAAPVGPASERAGQPSGWLDQAGSGEPIDQAPTGGRIDEAATGGRIDPAGSGGWAGQAGAPDGAGSGERVRSLFEPVTPAAEPTVPLSPAAGPAPATETEAAPAGTPSAARPATVPADFLPANKVEEELLAAVASGSTDGFLSTLLLARVLLPVAAESPPGTRPGDPAFVWRTEQLDGETYVVVYTSPERLADRVEGPVDTVGVKFVQLIRRWPDQNWSFAVNPGTPVGAKYPGEQVLALANWAAEVGLGDDAEGEPEPPAAEPAAPARPAAPPVDPSRPVTMQKAIAPSQLAYYLERGYDRVSGFVHRAGELAHLNTPAKLYDALGLGHPDSPFSRDAEEIYVLRWPAYRPSLYRIPYGGQNEAAMRAMEGWVIERPPFRGNGFAPGESSDVVAEFKVDSARLPHGAQLWRIGADGSERLVAVLDTDAVVWRRAGDES